MYISTAVLAKAKAKQGLGKYKKDCVSELRFMERELSSLIIQEAPEADIQFKRIAIKCLRDSIIDMCADY